VVLLAAGAALAAAARAPQSPGGSSEPAAAELAGRIELIAPAGQKAGPSGTVIWLPGLPASAEAAGTRISSKNKRFEPHVLAVPRGSSVAFPNLDPIYHNAFSLSPGNSFDLGLYRKGASRSARLDTPGLVRVYCNIHPDMAAYMMVVDGASAVVGDDGGYRVRGIPAGRHEVRLWNEMAGEKSVALDFSAGRATQWSLTLDASQYRRVQHKNKHGKSYPPATKDADRY
jgi:plastocyanin